MKNRRFKTFRLPDIDAMDLMIWSCKPKLAQDLKRRIGEEGGRILTSRSAVGVSRRPILQALGVLSDEMEIIFAICRSEDCKAIIDKIAMEFGFDSPGRGKAFAISIDGYLGGKGQFVEVV